MFSNHLRFGLLLLIFPGTPSPSLACPHILLLPFNTYPYHFNLLSCTFLDVSPTFAVPQISFLILSSLAIPLTHVCILISATSNFFYCAFFTAHVSAPYIIAGLTSVVYTFPVTLKPTLRSHRTPDTPFQFFHSQCILLVISSSKSPFSANGATIYLNVITLSKFSSCRFVSEFPSKFPSPVNLKFTV